jgi:hypothetical protein
VRRNEERITAPGVLEILAPHGEDFTVAVEWVPDADRLGCGAVRSRHRDRVGIFEENEDRIVELAVRQPVPIEPLAFGSNPEIANQFDEAGGWEGVAVKYSTAPERLDFRIVSVAYAQPDQAGQRRVTGDYRFVQMLSRKVDRHSHSRGAVDLDPQIETRPIRARTDATSMPR